MSLYAFRGFTKWETAVIHHPRYGNQGWNLSNTPIRKNQTCAICRRSVAKGTERMYRPFGNPMNRMERICINCVTKEAGNAQNQ